MMGAAGSLFWGFLSERIVPHIGIALVYISAAVSVLAVLVSCGPSGPVGREINIGGAPGSNPDRNAATGGRAGWH